MTRCEPSAPITEGAAARAWRPAVLLSLGLALVACQSPGDQASGPPSPSPGTSSDRDVDLDAREAQTGSEEDPSPEESAEPKESAEPETPAEAAGAGGLAGAWQDIPAAPIPGRQWHAAAWTGEELVVAGGYGEPEDPETQLERREAAAYDPASGRWRELSPMPSSPVTQPQSIWTGPGDGTGELIAWTTRGGSADPPVVAAYDVAADRWRELPAGPVDETEGEGAVWTGDQLVAWGHSTGFDLDAAPDPSEAATPQATLAPSGDPRGDLVVGAYDPADDRWDAVEAAPLEQPRFDTAGVWTGEELVLWGGYDVGGACAGECPPRDARTDAAAYEPATGRWRELAEVDDDVVRAREAWWTGADVLLAGDDGYLRWDPEDGTVTPAAPLPDLTGDGEVIHTWTGDRLIRLVLPDPTRPERVSGGALYDPAADRWEPLTPREMAVTSEPSATWTGEPDCTGDCDGELLLWGGSEPIPDPGGGATPPPPRLDVGHALDPDAVTPPAEPVSGDWAVDVEVDVPDDVPFAITSEDVADLPTEAAASHVLALAEGEDDLWVATGQAAGTLEAGEGRLLALVPGCSSGVDEQAPWRGETSACDGAPDDASTGQLVDVPAGERRLLEVTLRTQPEPFAAVPGTYALDLPIAWWDTDPEPADASGEGRPPPSGTATVRVTYTLTGITPEGQDPRAGQVAAREAAEPASCAAQRAPLSSGDPEDGGLAVEVDGFGHFGRQANDARMVDVTPTGGVRGQRVGELLVIVDGLYLRDCVGSRTGPPLGAEITVLQADRTVGTATWDELELEVETILDAASDDPRIVQRLTITNLGDEARQVPVIRGLVHDTPLEGEGPVDGVASADGATLHAVEVELGTAVRLTGDRDGDPVPDAWAGADDRSAVDRAIDGRGIPDELAAALEEPTGASWPASYVLLQQWDAELGPGESTVVTSQVAFGQAPGADDG